MQNEAASRPTNQDNKNTKQNKERMKLKTVYNGGNEAE